jgi:mono/diheme cytochrome c family protein
MMRGLLRGRVLVVAAVTVSRPSRWPGPRRRKAPDSEKGKKNPLPAGAKTVADGKKVADVNCASCHGAAGRRRRRPRSTLPAD